MTLKIKRKRRSKLVNVLADILNRLCERNDKYIMTNTTVTRFHALRAPEITTKFYIKRIAKYSSCSEESFVLALIYIDRLISKNGNFLVNSLNVHRLIITSIMLAVKFFDDQYLNNAYFGEVGGVSCKEMNLLEIEFLFMINFELYVESDLFHKYQERLLNRVEDWKHRTVSKEVVTLKTKHALQAQKIPHSTQAVRKPTQIARVPTADLNHGPGKHNPISVNSTQQVKQSLPSCLQSRASLSATTVNCRRGIKAKSVPSSIGHYIVHRCVAPSTSQSLENIKRIH